MPELPEVETVRRGLKGLILGAKITKIEILCEKSFIGKPINGTLRNIRRFGKALVMDLDGGKSLMIHLRMTGQLIWRTSVHGRKEGDGEPAMGFAGGHPSENFVAELPNRQTRVILQFDKGTLYFNDQRKFGFIKVIETEKVEDDEFIQRLAPEPWEIDFDEFYAKLQKRKNSPIKSVILDQSVVCGLGNIYADEALYLAGIHPKRLSGKISLFEARSLLESACMVMDKSLAAGGSTLQNYLKPDGTRGNYLDLFAQVYHREGEPCMNCGTKIEKIKVGGRGTHYCPKCQNLDVTSVMHVENPVENFCKNVAVEEAKLPNAQAVGEVDHD